MTACEQEYCDQENDMATVKRLTLLQEIMLSLELNLV